jgi:hypothetical protein
VDGQDRGGDANPLWHCAQQTRIAQSVMRGKTIASAAGGTAPVYHWLAGTPVDNRWRETGRALYQWLARHGRHFRNRRSLADIAVVHSQCTLCFYGGQGGRTERTDHIQGLYYALLQTRLPFDFVHEDDLGPGTLDKYRALLLPNVALLGDPRADFGIGDVLGVRKAGATQGPLPNSYARVEAEGHQLLSGIGPTALLPGGLYRVPVGAAAPPVEV